MSDVTDHEIGARPAVVGCHQDIARPICPAVSARVEPAQRDGSTVERWSRHRRRHADVISPPWSERQAAAFTRHIRYVAHAGARPPGGWVQVERSDNAPAIVDKEHANLDHGGRPERYGIRVGADVGDDPGWPRDESPPLGSRVPAGRAIAAQAGARQWPAAGAGRRRRRAVGVCGRSDPRSG